MTELAVPLALAFALSRGVRDARWRALLYLGVCLPDLGRALIDLQGAGPASLAFPLHSPLGLAVWCAAVALLFEEDWRLRAFAALTAGGLFHLAIDALAAPADSGRGVYWALPWTVERLELGLLPETSPWLLRTGAAGVVIAAALLTSRVRRSAP